MARSLLVGSLNLDSADAVFEAVGQTLSSNVSRVPDGETGDRLGWIFALQPRIAENPSLERTDASWGGDSTISHVFPQFRPRAGIVPETVEFGNLGYADDALASWASFERRVPTASFPSTFASRWRYRPRSSR